MKVKTYDKENLVPVIKKSICTGEAVVGFKNKHTHEFIEMLLITDYRDLEKFMKEYGITEPIKTEY